MKISTVITFLLFLNIGFMACIAANDPVPEKPKENYLEFAIDGQVWKADNEIFGSYHFSEALGPKLIQISGNKGHGSTQQVFTINLYHTVAEGEYSTTRGKEDVAQLANLSPSNYLCGGTMQSQNLQVKIVKVTKNPQHIEATFSGTMQCVEGNQIHITNGKFYYHEN